MKVNTEPFRAVRWRFNKIGRLSEELNRKDSELRSRLVAAAVAGLRLIRHPYSPECGLEAATAWNSIEQVLADLVAAKETPTMQERSERSRRISPEVLLRVHKCRSKLKQLASALEESDIRCMPERTAVKAGRLLCGLAVCLDDAIVSEEDKIFPAIHQALFETDRNV